MTSVTSYRVKLEESTLFEGYCGLEYGLERSWITTFQLTSLMIALNLQIPIQYTFTSLNVKYLITLPEKSVSHFR